MDRRNLYKVGGEKFGQTATKLKRKEKAYEDRTLRRNDLFQVVRNIKESPAKENGAPLLKAEDKLSRKEALRRRFLAWKAEKEKKKEEENKNKPRPFYSTVNSFAPKDCKFEPPSGINCHPLNKEKLRKNKIIEKEATKEYKFESGLKCHQFNNKDKLPKGKKTEKQAPKDNKFEPGLNKNNNKVHKIKNTENEPPKGDKFEPLSGLKCQSLNKDKVPKIKKTEKEIKKFSKPLVPLKNEIASKRRDINEKISLKQSVNSLKPPKVTAIRNIIDQTPKEKECLQNSFLNRFTSTSRKTAPIDREQFCDEDIISPIEDVVQEPKSDAGASTEKDPCKNMFFSSKVNSNPEKQEANIKTVDLNVTPQNDNKSPNYVSPFVTVSRGKVSNKKEKEKRESIYRLEISSPGEPIHVRRARESIKYFRTVLNDEIERLLTRCKVWENYQAENSALLEECGSDMINATVGQTKLLTSKKLEQFRDLIDRCEAHTITGNLEGSLQSVLPEDLEGFWSMVRLQIENVDKRFENLERWKANEWRDPDEVKQNTKKLTTKVLKAKMKKSKPIKPNEALRTLLKKAHSLYQQSKKENICTDTDIILVTKKRRSSNSARISTVNTPVRRSKRLETPKRLDSPKQSAIGAYKITPYTRKSAQKHNSPKNSTPKRSIVGRQSLLMEALSNSHARKSRGSTGRSQTKPRKSILKTPGTAKRDKRAVFFNEQLDYKSPEVYSTENSLSGIDLLEQTPSEMQRSLNLRSRRVILRPDHEIEIP